MIVSFGLGPDPAVSVEVPSEALGRAVTELFPDYRRSEEDPHASAPRLTIRESTEGFTLEGDGTHGDDPSMTTTDREELLAAVEGALARMLLRQSPGAVQLHAAGAVVPEGAVLALGPAGAGKSSVALAWSAAGIPLLGDDILFLDAAGRAGGFRRLVKAEAERLLEHGYAPERTPHWSPRVTECWFDPRVAGGWSTGFRRVRTLAFLERGGAGESVLELERPEALALLLDHVTGGDAPADVALDILLSLLDGALPVRLSFDSSARAAGLLLELARAGAIPEVR
jgi:hypothetical protein